MVASINCELPAPHIDGISWRPSSCSGLPAVIQVIEAITTYICDNIVPVPDAGNNNIRVVPGGTDSSLFNAEFYLGVPADTSIVLEGGNIWWSVDAGANWDILEISAFQVGNAGDFADPDNPTPAELRTLFPQSQPAENALVYSTHNKHLYTTQDSGVSWDDTHYVDALGDTMTGALNFIISEVDPVADTSAVNIDITNNGNLFGSFLHGIIINTNMNTAGDLGKTFGISIQNVVQSDATSDAGDAYGINIDSMRSGGTGTSTNMVAYHAETITNSSTGDITNAYGLKIANQNQAINNYAIHTGVGLNHFGDQVKIVGNQDITQFYIVGDNAQTNPIIEIDDSASNAMFYLLADGEINILPRNTAGNGGGSTLYIETPARTAMGASTEEHSIYFDVTPVKQWSAGAITNQREVMFERPTYAFTSASTITNAATVYIKNAPAAGTNATITNAYALWIDDGAVRIDGSLGLGGAQPTARSTGWAVTNPTTRKTYDTTTITLPQLAEVVGTMIDYFILRGDFGA